MWFVSISHLCFVVSAVPSLLWMERGRDGSEEGQLIYWPCSSELGECYHSFCLKGALLQMSQASPPHPNPHPHLQAPFVSFHSSST